MTTEYEKISEIVQKYLEPHQPQDYRLNVVPNGIKKNDDYYYVVVRPSRDDIRSYDFYAALAEAEIDLVDKENLNILLVPAMPAS